MGIMDQQWHLENTTSPSSLRQLIDFWRNPRGIVPRIEALALVAIALTFFLATFGSCRRWSNWWIIQKGFLAANALFLSLGTYSIGLMQSSPVKSEMYPIWSVSLLALLCCIDSATAASGLDSRSQLWKMLYQLCLYFGYVLWMSTSTISSDIGNIATCVLSTITFVKGFHRSMALVLPSSLRNMVREIPDYRAQYSFGVPIHEVNLVVYDDLDITMDPSGPIYMNDIASVMMCKDDGDMNLLQPELLDASKDVSLSLSLSHLLLRRFLGVRSSSTGDRKPLVEDFTLAFKLVETELAFLYDVLYTSNAFIHYYEAKDASLWAFTSAIGVCFVGAVAFLRLRPGQGGGGGPHVLHAGTVLVDATVADLVITGVILVSLALLQVLQLVRCWTSNWARVAFACDCLSWWMRLKASLVRINWSDKYLWQNKLGQHSIVESVTLPLRILVYRVNLRIILHHDLRPLCFHVLLRPIPEAALDSGSVFAASLPVMSFLFADGFLRRCLGTLGVPYVGRELREILQGSGMQWNADVVLHPEVKESIGAFVSEQIIISCNEASVWWASSLLASSSVPAAADDAQSSGSGSATSHHDPAAAAAVTYTSCILKWRIATCYLELAQQRDGNSGEEAGAADAEKKDRRVAMALSKYCMYLVVSAPQLLPGRPDDTRRLYDGVRNAAREALKGQYDELKAMERYRPDPDDDGGGFSLGVKLRMQLRQTNKETRGKGWKELADFWVKALVYAAPSDNVEEHMHHLSQGGELITHLWALLYHAGIDKWQLNPPLPPPQQRYGVPLTHAGTDTSTSRSSLVKLIFRNFSKISIKIQKI
ncbi:hypothetical protein BS78_08G004800 [Paspalum vaginatum]|nr:hypothetical protein BS78_08G004800 [Paspalum vaginatum]